MSTLMAIAKKAMVTMISIANTLVVKTGMTGMKSLVKAMMMTVNGPMT